MIDWRVPEPMTENDGSRQSCSGQNDRCALHADDELDTSLGDCIQIAPRSYLILKLLPRLIRLQNSPKPGLRPLGL